jgi:hypothetical protein
MAVPSMQTKTIVEGDLADHLDANEHRWPALDDVRVSWRGSYGYLTAVFLDGHRTPIARIGHTGDVDTWDFALYDPATDAYTPARLTTGAFQGTIAEAIDTAALVHLTEQPQPQPQNKKQN